MKRFVFFVLYPTPSIRRIVPGALVLAVSSLPSAHADIVGGVEVSPRDPIRSSTAALYSPSADGRGGALCTASLIGKDMAVTAAHCINPGGPQPVLIFGNDVHSPDSIKQQASAVAVNPRWQTHQGKGMDQGDIALVRFPGGLPEGYHTIATQKSDAALKRGQATVLAGYGISNARTDDGAGTLRKAQVQIANPRPGKSEMILDQSHGRGACHGDSGGPAYVSAGGHAVLAGVTNRSYPNSAPNDCAHKVVYTKVSEYQPWIQQTEQRLRAGSGQSEGTLAAHRVGRKVASAHPSAQRRPSRLSHGRRPVRATEHRRESRRMAAAPVHARPKRVTGRHARR